MAVKNQGKEVGLQQVLLSPLQVQGLVEVSQVQAMVEISQVQAMVQARQQKGSQDREKVVWHICCLETTTEINISLHFYFG